MGRLMTKRSCWAHVCFVPLLIMLLELDSPARAQEAQVPYEVKIEGVDNDGLRQALLAASALEVRKDRPPDSVLVLRRLAERDEVNLLRALRAQAYYGAEVTLVLDESARPVEIVMQVEPGRQYEFVDVEIDYVERPENPPQSLPDVYDLSLSLYRPALTNDILASQGELVTLLKERGFPYPETLQPRVTVDHATRGVHVVYPVRTGPVASFGKTEIEGNTAVRESFLRARIPWKRGDLFDSRLLDKYDKYLRDTGLFSASGVNVVEHLDEQGRVPIRVDLRERTHRTLTLGIRFQSDEGLGARVSWENRNLFGREEHLTLNGLVSQEEYTLEAIYMKPQFVRPDQVLRLQSKASEEDTEAYYARSASVSASVERALTERLSVGTGLGFRALNVRQFNEDNTYNLVSAPSFFNADFHKGDPLNPVGGWRLALRLTPFLDISNSGVSFLRSQVTYTHYVQVTETPRVVLAGRVNVGAIAGSQRNRIPADERFYAGGGGSIRGYEHQKVGPLRDDTPLGGRSLLEFSIEARTRISNRFGIVPFIDGGTVFESAYPTFGRTLRWGAGIGFRYFSPIGPIRFDVAVPLNRRSGIDKAFQIYISLGQAF